MHEAKCKGCGADIVFGVTKKGKSMPLDAKPVTAFDLEWPSVPGTPEEPGEQDPPQVTSRKVYTSHFATCPNADRFRKRRRR